MESASGNGYQYVILKGQDGTQYIAWMNQALVEELRQVFGMETEFGIVQKMLEADDHEVGSGKTSFHSKIIGKLVNV